MDLRLGDTKLIIDYARRNNVSTEQLAYILATAYWETNRTMKPVVEAYWLSERWRSKNLRYYPWHGRGYVQLTWRSNYEFVQKTLGVRLLADPDLALRPEVAVPILVRGSMEGWFTGRRLSDYVNDQKKDYRNARRVINGVDKAAQIAKLAEEYEVLLKKSPPTVLSRWKEWF